MKRMKSQDMCGIVTTDKSTKGAQLMFWITPNIQLMNGFYKDSDRVSAPFFGK